MSTHTHIDRICIAVTLLSLLLTLVFMNGDTLGIRRAGEESEDLYFTENDMDADWSTEDATVIRLTGDGGTVRGNGAYIANGDVHIVYAGKYLLSGTLTDGSVIIDADGDDLIRLSLNGVSLHAEDTAALLIEQADKVILTLAEQTENFISCGESFSEEVLSSGIDGAIYSRDDLSVNGSGSLTVTAPYRHGIVCNDDLVMTGGELYVDAAQDAIHAGDSFRLAAAALTLSAGDDAVTVENDDQTDYLYIESGRVSVSTCYEGLEATTVSVTGGVVDITSSDDGLNAQELIKITGGDIRIVNENGRDADGFDSNGDIRIEGGNIFISVPNDGSSSALDYGSERGGICRIDGGTLIACGSRQMQEAVEESSAQAFLMCSAEGESGSSLTLRDESGNVLLSETIPNSFSSVIVSTPEMRLGGDYTIVTDGTETSYTADNSSLAGDFSPMGRDGPGGKPPFPKEEKGGERPDFDPSQAPPDGGDRPDFDPSQAPPDGERPPKLKRDVKSKKEVIE